MPLYPTESASPDPCSGPSWPFSGPPAAGPWETPFPSDWSFTRAASPRGPAKRTRALFPLQISGPGLLPPATALRKDPSFRPGSPSAAGDGRSLGRVATTRALPGPPASSGEQQPPCPPNPVSGVQPPRHGHSLNRIASGLEKTSPSQPPYPTTRWCERVRSMSLGNNKASDVPAKCSVSPMVPSHPTPADAPSVPSTLAAGARQLDDAPRAGSAGGTPGPAPPRFGGYQLVSGGFRTTTADATSLPSPCSRPPSVFTECVQAASHSVLERISAERL